MPQKHTSRRNQRVHIMTTLFPCPPLLRAYRMAPQNHFGRGRGVRCPWSVPEFVLLPCWGFPFASGCSASCPTRLRHRAIHKLDILWYRGHGLHELLGNVGVVARGFGNGQAQGDGDDVSEEAAQPGDEPPCPVHDELHSLRNGVWIEAKGVGLSLEEGVCETEGKESPDRLHEEHPGDGYPRVCVDTNSAAMMDDSGYSGRAEGPSQPSGQRHIPRTAAL